MERGYLLLKSTSFDKAKREFRGMATTPDVDLVGDVVDPMGATFAETIPLLLQHDRERPIGTVKLGKATAKGIPFVAVIAEVDEPGILKDRLDEAWQSIKAGLIKAVSVGMRVTERTRNAFGGYNITKYNVDEVSAVTFPANTRATIELAKSLDRANDPAAIGNGTNNERAGDAARTVNRKTVNYSNTIAELETELAEATENRDILLSKSLDTGLTADEDGEYDATEARVADLTKSLDRVRKAAGEAVAKATPITNVKSFAAGSALRARVPATVAPTVEKGVGFTMLTLALAAGRGNLMQSARIAERSEFDRVPAVREVLKSAVAAGTTSDPTWAKPLVQYQTLANEFIELIRAESILGRISGLRRVPFNVRVSSQTSGSTVNWVAEGKLKPVSKLGFAEVNLGFNKLAGIVTVSDELIKFADQNVISIVQNDLVAATAEFLDDAFLNPAHAATGSNPASVTNGVTAVAASGKTVDHLKADVKKVFGAYLAAGLSVAGSVWIMSGVQALAISMLTNAVGQREFPEISMLGGTFFGLPVLVSEAPVTAGRIALVKANEIFLAEDGLVLDSSREASIVMDTDPNRAGAPAAVNMWQSNQVALRVEQFINWQKRHEKAVAVISGADYGGIAA